MIERLIKSTDTFKELAILYVSLISVGSIVFHLVEHKPLLDSFWWAMVTAMTLGYGDLYPVTLLGRIDALVLMHVVPLFIIPLIVVRLCTLFVKNPHEFSHEEQEQIKGDLQKIKHSLNIK